MLFSDCNRSPSCLVAQAVYILLQQHYINGFLQHLIVASFYIVALASQSFTVFLTRRRFCKPCFQQKFLKQEFLKQEFLRFMLRQRHGTMHSERARAIAVVDLFFLSAQVVTYVFGATLRNAWFNINCTSFLLEYYRKHMEWVCFKARFTMVLLRLDFTLLPLNPVTKCSMAGRSNNEVLRIFFINSKSPEAGWHVLPAPRSTRAAPVFDHCDARPRLLASRICIPATRTDIVGTYQAVAHLRVRLTLANARTCESLGCNAKGRRSVRS